jgi:hypothetical protein
MDGAYSMHGRNKNTYIILVGKPEGRRDHLGDTSYVGK